MPVGVYKRTDEARKHMSEARKGKPSGVKGKHWKLSEEAKRNIGAGSKGRKLSEETKKKISLSHSGNKNYNFGTHLSEEHKNKISQSMKGKRKSDETKKKFSMAKKGTVMSLEARLKMSLSKKGKPSPRKGAHLSDETKQKIRVANIGKKPGPVSEETRKKIGNAHRGKIISDKHKQILRQSRLKQVFPVKDTKIEVMLQEELSNRGYGYYKHYPIIGQPDIAFPDKRIAIFCDGDYYHACPDKYKANDTICRKKAAQIWEKDKRISNELKQKKWLVIRYWEHEINANLDAIVDEIEDIIFTREEVNLVSEGSQMEKEEAPQPPTITPEASLPAQETPKDIPVMQEEKKEEKNAA
jgi:DNA mismatch endonuclease (patch repair protein)